MEQLYSIEEVAKMLGVSYITIYRQVAFCKNCKKKIHSCTCDEFKPALKAYNVSGEDNHIKWRIPISLLEKELERRTRR